MHQLEQDSRKREQQEAQDRQLDRAMAFAAAAAAPAKKQKTLANHVSQGLPNNCHQQNLPRTPNSPF
eukprot:1157732-Pelagomonas_calceolata.AAC.11